MTVQEKESIDLHKVTCPECGEQDVIGLSMDPQDAVEEVSDLAKYGVPEDQIRNSLREQGKENAADLLCNNCGEPPVEPNITPFDHTKHENWSSRPELIEEVLQSHGHDSLNKTQALVISQANPHPGNNLITAPTGNGKTLCAEIKIKQLLEDNKRIAYLVPSAQLKDAKYDELSKSIDAKIKVSGQDNDPYAESDVTISTFEGFYQKIVRDPALARDFGLAVLDDFHYLYDTYRGFTLEKVITGLKKESVPILAMSATIGSPQKIADWMDAKLIESPENRRIPLREKVYERKDKNKIDQISNIITENGEESPFIIFNATKSDAEQRAKKVAEERGWQKGEKNASLSQFQRDPSENARPGPDPKITQQDLKDVVPSITEEIERLTRMMEWGVAYHHAGLPQEMRQYIEEAMKEGDIDCISATTTIASGYDSPAKTVLVADHKRWRKSEGTTVDIDVYEITQWIGRAGRPSYDHEYGNAWFLASTEESVEQYRDPRELEEIKSNVAQNELMRKFLLEIIVNRADTEDELKSFINKTLFDHESVDEVMGIEVKQESTLEDNIGWLESKEFIELTYDGQFRATELGRAAVNYGFQQYGRYKLTGVRKIYDYLDENEEYSKVELLAKLCDFGERSLYKSDEEDITEETEQRMEDNGLDPESSADRTATVLHDFWCAGEDVEDAVKATGMRAEYTGSMAQDMLDLLSLAERIIKLKEGHQVPEWWNTYRLQIRHGVTEDMAEMVDEIDQLGRRRAVALKAYVTKTSDTQSNDIVENLLDVFEGNDKQQIIDTLDDQVGGIGKTVGERVANYIRKKEAQSHG